MNIIDIFIEAADAPALRQRLTEAEAEVEQLKAQLASLRGELAAAIEGRKVYYDLYCKAERKTHGR